VSPDALAGIGAFLSGMGAVVGAFYTIGRLRKRMEKECEERFAAFREGIRTGERLERKDDDVSP
jgi:hypothetical protein